MKDKCAPYELPFSSGLSRASIFFELPLKTAAMQLTFNPLNLTGTHNIWIWLAPNIILPRAKYLNTTAVER